MPRKATTKKEETAAVVETKAEAAAEAEIKEEAKAEKKIEAAAPVNEEKAEEKAAPEPKKPAKKAGSKTAKTAKEVVEKAEKAVKNAAAKAVKKTVEPTTSVYVQFLGKEIVCKDVVSTIKQLWVSDMGKKEADLKDVKVYIKPEDNGAYYVLNGDITGFLSF